MCVYFTQIYWEWRDERQPATGRFRHGPNFGIGSESASKHEGEGRERRGDLAHFETPKSTPRVISVTRLAVSPGQGHGREIVRKVPVLLQKKHCWNRPKLEDKPREVTAAAKDVGIYRVLAWFWQRANCSDHARDSSELLRGNFAKNVGLPWLAKFTNWTIHCKKFFSFGAMIILFLSYLQYCKGIYIYT